MMLFLMLRATLLLARDEPDTPSLAENLTDGGDGSGSDSGSDGDGGEGRGDANQRHAQRNECATSLLSCSQRH